mmetsp:Transcript_27370/g.43445  ORF Transcript_27370/g.43445 Transcript_27370/m.43445 type:complete len:285 (-) Transcript_27370:488-1342(-)
MPSNSWDLTRESIWLRIDLSALSILSCKDLRCGNFSLDSDSPSKAPSNSSLISASMWMSLAISSRFGAGGPPSLTWLSQSSKTIKALRASPTLASSSSSNGNLSTTFSSRDPMTIPLRIGTASPPPSLITSSTGLYAFLASFAFPAASSRQFLARICPRWVLHLTSNASFRVSNSNTSNDLSSTAQSVTFPSSPLTIITPPPFPCGDSRRSSTLSTLLTAPLTPETGSDVDIAASIAWASFSTFSSICFLRLSSLNTGLFPFPPWYPPRRDGVPPWLPPAFPTG